MYSVFFYTTCSIYRNITMFWLNSFKPCQSFLVYSLNYIIYHYDQKDSVLFYFLIPVRSRKFQAFFYISSRIARQVFFLNEICEAWDWVRKMVGYWLFASTQSPYRYGNKGAGCSQSITRDQFQIKPVTQYTVLFQLIVYNMNVIMKTCFFCHLTAIIRQQITL